MTLTLPDRPRILALTGPLLDMDVDALEPIRAHADVVLATTPGELAREIADVDILLVWDFRFADLDELIPRAPRLRWIHAASVGVDALITPNLISRDIVLTNSRGVFDRAIAEYVLGLYLLHCKDYLETSRRQAERTWSHRITQKAQGRRAVVVGSGSIGRDIARLLAAIDMNVVLVGRREVADDPDFGRIRAAADLTDVVSDADLLVLAAPGTAANRHMVDAAVFTALPDHAFLINVGRGSLVDEEALAHAAASGGIGGAALDVFQTEPLSEGSPFWSAPNIVVSPHMSADFEGYENALVDVFLSNLERVRRGEALAGVVDLQLGYVPSA